MEDINLPEEENKTVEEFSSQSENQTAKKCYPVNKLMLAFNIILLAGLIVLYILFFTSGKSEETTAANTSVDSKIAFVNSDSLKEHYVLVKELHDSLESKYNALDKEMKGRQASFEARAMEYQKKINSNSITVEQAQKTEQQLMAEQQALLELKDKYTASLADQEYKMNERFIDSVSNFLKRYNKDNSFDYILGYTKGGGILLANDKLDITKQVIEGLNKEYKSAPSKTK